MHSSTPLLASAVAIIAILVFGVAALRICVVAQQRRVGRARLRLLDCAPGFADGVINGLPLLEAAQSINPHVIDALGRWGARTMEPWSLMSYVKEHHGAIFSPGGHFVDGLKGYVAESIVSDHFAALHHEVVLATTTNQPGWDMLIDGQPFQVKSGATAARMAHDHLLVHPDIPVITDPEAAHHLLALDPHSVLAVHEIGAAKLEVTTTGTLHGIDTLGHVGAVHVPCVTVAITSYREIVRLSRGHTTFNDVLAHVVIDAAGVGIGMAGGAKTGAVIGGRFGGLHGVAVGGFIGTVVGGVAGKLAATFAKEARLRSFAKKYRREVALASASFTAAERQTSLTVRNELRGADRALGRERRGYAKSLREKHQAAKLTVAVARGELARAGRAHLKRAVSSDAVLALPRIASGDQSALPILLRSAEAVDDRVLLAALARYIALFTDLQGQLTDSIDGYSEMMTRYDLESRTMAAEALRDLCDSAVRLFAGCDSLRSDIEAELRKLGKPVPALPSG